MFDYVVQKEDYKLTIRVSVYCKRDGMQYTIADVLYTPKGKRKAISVGRVVNDSWEYRRRDYEDRDEYVKAEYMKWCLEDDIKNAIQYAYSMLAPYFENVDYRCT